jgi:hypothetical protein
VSCLRAPTSLSCVGTGIFHGNKQYTKTPHRSKSTTPNAAAKKDRSIKKASPLSPSPPPPQEKKQQITGKKLVKKPSTCRPPHPRTRKPGPPRDLRPPGPSSSSWLTPTPSSLPSRAPPLSTSSSSAPLSSLQCTNKHYNQ